MRPGAAIAGAAAICFAAILWGLDGVVLTPRLTGLPPAFVVFLLHAVPFALMQPFLFRRYRELAVLRGRNLASLVAVSLTGGLVGTLAIVHALFLVNFDMLSVVVLLQKLQPVFAIVLAGLLLKEPISGAFVTRAAVALVGAYLLTFGASLPSWDGDVAIVHASLWAVLAAACFGAATTLGKILVHAADPVTATFGRYGVTTVLALLWAVVSGARLPIAEVTTIQWGIVLAIGLTTGTGAIALYYWGLRSVRATTATICELCLPLSAVLFDYLVNRTVLSTGQWLGAAILISAILSISLSQAAEGKPAAIPLRPHS